MKFFTYLKELFNYDGAKFAYSMTDSFTGNEKYWDPSYKE